MTWPSLNRTFKDQGAFSFYAVWNLIGWWLVSQSSVVACHAVSPADTAPFALQVLLFVPETAKLTLEELDQVFSVPTHTHAAYGLRQIPYFIGRYILRRDLKPERLYEREDDHYDEPYEKDPEKRV